MKMDTPYIAQNPVDAFGQRFASLKFSSSLDASTDTTLTVPDSAPKYKAVIKGDVDLVIWVALGETAAVPAGNTFAAVSSEMVPVNGELCREVRAGEVLHFICATASADVSVVFYAIGTNN
jgi:hypothetical protein